MKRSLFVLMALLLATPALGTVTITCTDEGEGLVRIDYVNTEPNKVRAFALDVSIDANCTTISSVTNYSGGTGDKYGIFPGTIDLTDVENPVWNTPVAPSYDPGAGGTGLGTSRVILEMGSLYDPNLDGPGNNGMLCRMQLGDSNETSCHVSITVETTRGGVVMEDGNPPSSFVSTGCDVSFGWPYPPCWDWLGQCHGDTVGDDLVIALGDFQVFKDAFAVGTVPGDCPKGDINEIYKP
jgi:hypothetical protein